MKTIACTDHLMQRPYNEPVTDDKAPNARVRQRDETRARILSAARQLFGQAGYDRATIRAIAERAGVNPGLVMHYFQSKELLYREAVSLAPAAPSPGLSEDLAGHLLESLRMKFDELPAESLAALRSMLSNPDLSREARVSADEQITGISEAVAAADAGLRAALVSSMILGVSINRHLLQIDAFHDATADQIIQLLRPCFDALLTPRLSGTARRTGGSAE